MTIITVSIVHSTAENNRPMTAKFFAYPCVVPRISRKISRAVCCFSTPGCEIFGFTDELNSPMAAPRPYPNVVMKSLFYLLLQLSAATGHRPASVTLTQHTSHERFKETTFKDTFDQFFLVCFDRNWANIFRNYYLFPIPTRVQCVFKVMQFLYD